mgnify:CR=1 FL=1
MKSSSAIFCFTLPAGMGLYWIAGSVVRTIQQIAINKYIDKMVAQLESSKDSIRKNENLTEAHKRLNP